MDILRPLSQTLSEFPPAGFSFSGRANKKTPKASGENKNRNRFPGPNTSDNRLQTTNASYSRLQTAHGRGIRCKRLRLVEPSPPHSEKSPGVWDNFKEIVYLYH